LSNDYLVDERLVHRHTEDIVSELDALGDVPFAISYIDLHASYSR
jgi:hypothetical protein